MTICYIHTRLPKLRPTMRNTLKQKSSILTMIRLTYKDDVTIRNSNLTGVRALLLGFMYFSHLLPFKRHLFERVGGFRLGFEGTQDYDLTLRLSEWHQRSGTSLAFCIIGALLPGQQPRAPRTSQKPSSEAAAPCKRR